MACEYIDRGCIGITEKGKCDASRASLREIISMSYNVSSYLIYIIPTFKR